MAKSYCSKAERKRLQGVYGHLYTRYEAERMPGGFGCFYCAEPAATMDHCPPLAWIEGKSTGYFRRLGIGFHLIASCQECNSKLGSKGLFTPLERVQFMRKSLEDEYEKKMTLWSDDEIGEISPMFQKSIQARKNGFRILLEKVRAAQWRELSESDRNY